MTDQPVWSGPYVICTVCAGACVPTWNTARDEWVLPEHMIPLTTGATEPCPGSLAGCVKPVHATMAERIESHVVAAMPPEHQNIPDAKGLTEPDPMKGPGQ